MHACASSRNRCLFSNQNVYAKGENFFIPVYFWKLLELLKNISLSTVRPVLGGLTWKCLNSEALTATRRHLTLAEFFFPVVMVVMTSEYWNTVTVPDTTPSPKINKSTDAWYLC